MAAETQTEARDSGNSWLVITRGLLVGFVVFNAFLVHVSVTTGNPPGGSEQLFAWVPAVGLTSYVLLRGDTMVGYALTIFTGILGIVVLGIVAAGTFGSLQPSHPTLSILFGPVAYLVSAIALILSASLAWRGAW